MAELIERGFTKSLGYPKADLGSGEGKRATGAPVTPTEPDEEQEEERERKYSVLIGSKEIKFVCDDTGCSFVDPSDGHGLHIQKNGDIIIVSGGGGNGKLCGGRFMINTKGGVMQKHAGPIITEAAANPNNPLGGEGSTETGQSTSPGNTKNVACSELYYGDAITECHGEVRIRATNIVIEAADVLSLIGKGSVLIQAGPEGGGQLVINSGKTIETTSISETIVAGAKTTIAPEETTFQYDPRASVNVVSGGHMNIKAAGDISMGATGAIEMIALGLKKPLGLIKDPVSTISMKTVAGGLTLTSAAFTNITAVGPLTQASNAATITSTTLLTMISGTGASILTGTGNVDITATAGNVNLKGLLIYLN